MPPSPTHTARVLAVLRATAALPPPRAGWEALGQLWNIGPFNFAPTAVEELRSRPALCQEHDERLASQF